MRFLSKKICVLCLTAFAFVVPAVVGAECCTSSGGSCGSGYNCCMCCSAAVVCWNCYQGEICGGAECKADGTVKVGGKYCFKDGPRPSTAIEEEVIQE
jgi:hypothetical protein